MLASATGKIAKWTDPKPLNSLPRVKGRKIRFQKCSSMLMKTGQKCKLPHGFMLAHVCRNLPVSMQTSDLCCEIMTSTIEQEEHRKDRCGCAALSFPLSRPVLAKLLQTTKRYCGRLEDEISWQCTVRSYSNVHASPYLSPGDARVYVSLRLAGARNCHFHMHSRAILKDSDFHCLTVAVGYKKRTRACPGWQSSENLLQSKADDFSRCDA